jgi:hypothetical protein
MSFKLAMKEKTTLACYDPLPPGGVSLQSNRLRLAISSNKNQADSCSCSDSIQPEITAQNFRSVCRDMDLSSIFLIRSYAKQIRHYKALRLRLRNHGTQSLINIF